TAGRACLLGLPAKDLVLVVERLVAAGAQDRLAQPLQTEDEQQGADEEPQGIDRDQGERRPERADGRGERNGGGADARERRSPIPCHPDRQHDRQRLDHLDGAGDEGRREEEGGVHRTIITGQSACSATRSAVEPSRWSRRKCPLWPSTIRSACSLRATSTISS